MYFFRIFSLLLLIFTLTLTSLLSLYKYLFKLVHHHHQILLLLVEHRASMKSFQVLRSSAIPLTSFHDLLVILTLVFHFMPKRSPLISGRLLFISVSLTIVFKVRRLLAYSTRSQWWGCHLSLWAGWFSVGVSSPSLWRSPFSTRQWCWFWSTLGILFPQYPPYLGEPSPIRHSNWLGEQFCNLSSQTLYILSLQQIFPNPKIERDIKWAEHGV